MARHAVLPGPVTPVLPRHGLIEIAEQDTPYRRSVAARFLWIVLPLVAALSIGAGALIVQQRYESQLAALDAKLAYSLDVQRAVLAEPLWAYDRDRLKLVLAAVASYREFAAARVRDSSGVPLAEAGALVSLLDAVDNRIGEAVILAPTYGTDAPIGTIEIALTKAHLRSEVYVGIAAIAFFVAALVALVAAAIGLSARLAIRRPLDGLVAMIEGARAGRIDLQGTPCWRAATRSAPSPPPSPNCGRCSAPATANCSASTTICRRRWRSAPGTSSARSPSGVPPRRRRGATRSSTAACSMLRPT